MNNFQDLNVGIDALKNITDITRCNEKTFLIVTKVHLRTDRTGKNIEATFTVAFHASGSFICSNCQIREDLTKARAIFGGIGEGLRTPADRAYTS